MSTSPPQPPHDPSLAVTPPPLAWLLGRHSLGARHLGEPAPSPAHLQLMARAALRAPDHGRLAPCRFAVVEGLAREGLARLFALAAHDAGKGEDAAQLDAQRVREAPMTLAVLARIDLGHPQVPAHEQWVAVGGALTNLLNAAHALGYAGKMLSGRKARSARLVAAFAQPGETLLGWIALGTPTRQVAEKQLKPGIDEVLRHWTPPPDLPG